ncbi:carboxymuconolactone decarboxylase family protein [Bacillus salipaludis]
MNGNGCAFCLNMHTADLRKMGETEPVIEWLKIYRSKSIRL